jgi:hypothetical protein
MVDLSAAPLGSTTAAAKIKMRPCWPYDDAMKYRVTWSDGTVEDVYGDPDLYTRNHTFATYGIKTVSVLPLGDTKGRGPGRSASDSVNLTAWVFDPIDSVATKSIAP